MVLRVIRTRPPESPGVLSSFVDLTSARALLSIDSTLSRSCAGTIGTVRGRNARKGKTRILKANGLCENGTVNVSERRQFDSKTFGFRTNSEPLIILWHLWSLESSKIGHNFRRELFQQLWLSSHAAPS